MVWRACVFTVCGLALAGPRATAQQIPRLPAGVGVATIGSGIVDSTDFQYDNDGSTVNKLQAEGFGPLYGSLNAALVGLGALAPHGGSPVFDNVELRTRGYIYGYAYSHGISEKVTFNTRWRFGNVTTRIKGEDTADFARLSTLLTASGGEPADDAHMNDRLVDSHFSLAFWMDDSEVGDESTMSTALLAGYSYRGGWGPGQDLVKFALTELARMNRPPYLRLGFQSQIDGEESGLQFQFGAQANYHLAGDTYQANTAVLVNNTFASFGFSPAPIRRPIQKVDSTAHWGYEAHVHASGLVGPVRLGGGIYTQYEGNHTLRGLSRTGNPVADRRLVTERVTEERSFFRWTADWSTIEAYQRGEAWLPMVVSVQIDDSFRGRNLSELQIAQLRVSIPLSQPYGDA